MRHNILEEEVVEVVDIQFEISLGIDIHTQYHRMRSVVVVVVDNKEV